jgi:hypothetical protein
MIRKISLICPDCHQPCQLYLSSDARIIILNCPTCWAPIMYHNYGTYLLTNSQISDLKKDAGEKSLMNILHDIGEKKQPEPVSHEKNELEYAAVPVKKSAFQRKGSPISRDDITNLRIALETCTDTLEFINNL